MKISVMFDPHTSDKAPSTRVDNYCEAILKKIRFVIHKSNEENVHAVLISGDLFHKKIPSHNSHKLIRELISIFSESNSPVFCIAGNHDISGTVLNLDRQPISVLEESGTITLLNGSNPQLLSSDTLTVSISGFPYDSRLDCKENIDLYNVSFQDSADFKIGLYHQMILPDGMTFFNSYVNFCDLLNSSPNLIIDGHYHVGFNPSLISQGDKYFLNGGSLSRGSSDSFNLDKEPKFCMLELLKSSDGNISVSNTDIIVPYSPSKDVFDFVAIERKKENKVMKEFVDNLSEFEVSTLTSESPDGILQILRTMEVEDSVLPLAEKYLTKVYERMC